MILSPLTNAIKFLVSWVTNLFFDYFDYYVINRKEHRMDFHNILTIANVHAYDPKYNDEIRIDEALYRRRFAIDLYAMMVAYIFDCRSRYIGRSKKRFVIFSLRTYTHWLRGYYRNSNVSRDSTGLPYVKYRIRNWKDVKYQLLKDGGIVDGRRSLSSQDIRSIRILNQKCNNSFTISNTLIQSSLSAKHFNRIPPRDGGIKSLNKLCRKNYHRYHTELSEEHKQQILNSPSGQYIPKCVENSHSDVRPYAATPLTKRTKSA